MTSIYIFIKHHFKSVWGLVESINGPLTGKRYPNIRKKSEEVLKHISFSPFVFSLITKEDLKHLIEFRQRQRQEYLTYFDPHSFDLKTLGNMLDNPAYVMMKVTQESDPEVIIGYFFMRCFFIGKVFHGLIVDENFKNRGIGTEMWRVSNEICDSLRLRMYATVSLHNQASLNSAKKATDIRITENLANDFYLIECKTKVKK